MKYLHLYKKEIIWNLIELTYPQVTASNFIFFLVVVCTVVFVLMHLLIVSMESHIHVISWVLVLVFVLIFHFLRKVVVENVCPHIFNSFFVSVSVHRLHQIPKSIVLHLCEYFPVNKIVHFFCLIQKQFYQPQYMEKRVWVSAFLLFWTVNLIQAVS